MTVIAALPSEETVQKAQKTLLPRWDHSTTFTSICAQIRSQKRDHFTLPSPSPSQPLVKRANKCSFLQQPPCTVVCRENYYFRKAGFDILHLTNHPLIWSSCTSHTKSYVPQEHTGDVWYRHTTKLQINANKHVTNKLNSNKAPGDIINFVQQ